METDKRTGDEPLLYPVSSGGYKDRGKHRDVEAQSISAAWDFLSNVAL